MMLSHFRGKLLISWIPAFAGMTQFWLMDNLGLCLIQSDLSFSFFPFNRDSLNFALECR